jgi:tRNA A-37 threonylcarbamoyl transferase component Bud32
VTIAEAECLWIIKKRLGSEVPVPEVYGWQVDGKDVFIYMQLIQGRRLQECRDDLDVEGETGICDQLRQIVMSLRDLKQDPRDIFIGAYVSRKMWI